MVPTPENNSVVAGGKPVSTGTRNVAPNMATTCCVPRPMVRGQLRRSFGATTKSASERASTGSHDHLLLAGITVAYLALSPLPRARRTT